ncbi:hypothetical protein BJ165DRAFT_1411021 [Panaeolus papilionaceus]|nr:hypothetical protein BJ165DRAFT_1411021 [Panaeolus papilionaceus]
MLKSVMGPDHDGQPLVTYYIYMKHVKGQNLQDFEPFKKVRGEPAEQANIVNNVVEEGICFLSLQHAFGVTYSAPTDIRAANFMITGALEANWPLLYRTVYLTRDKAVVA